jgi:hypothetical protein
MIVVKIMGGIGNQLFQYALGRNLAIKNNTDLRLDLSSFDDLDHRPFKLDKLKTKIFRAKIADIPYRVRMTKLNKLRVGVAKIFGSNPKLRIEKQFNFDDRVLNYKDGTYLWGYWQCEKYFSEIKEIIKEEFQFKENIDSRLNSTAVSLRQFDSVCLHIRRGDYVDNPYYNILPLAYYKKALSIITKDLNEPKIFIFSDDIEWCVQNLKIEFPHEFISGNQDWEDLKLMTLCKHNIIANSSFGWWGAYLGIDKEKRIIAPKTWFSEKMGHNTEDLVLENWLKL